MFSTHILGGAKFCDADASRLVTAANRAIAPAAGRVGARRGSGPWRRRFAVASVATPAPGVALARAPPPPAPRLVDRGASSRRRRSSASDAPSSTAPLRLHPPSSPPLLPRVEHVILPADARAAGPACEVLARLVPGSPRVDETTIRELVALGAVWHAPRPPPPRPLKGLPGALRPRRVRDPDLHLAPGACRVHVHPKRFPAAIATAWRSPSSPAAGRSSSSTNPPA